MGKKVFIVGELNDQAMAAVILDELKDREISGHYFFDSERNSFVIAVQEEKYLEIALDIYRVKLGLKKPAEVDQDWVKIKSVPRGQLTFKIIIFSVIVYLISYFSVGVGLYSFFQIDGHETGFLIDVMNGQVWRVITPIFLHMGFLHILFNMLWFKDLGNLVEYKFGTLFLTKFIFVSGIVSNLLQYYFKGPSFGGMSGVLYGLLGLIWIYEKLNNDFEFHFPKHDLIMMIGWFFLCLFGIFPNVANFAHAGGLVVGIIWASVINFKLTKERIIYFSYGVLILLVTIIVEHYKWKINY
jgi:GlpG protein